MRSYNNFDFDHPLIAVPPAEDLRVIAVTPSLHEQKLFKTIESLFQAAKSYDSPVEMIVVLNESEDSDDEVKDFHALQWQQLLRWAEEHNDHKFSLHPIWIKNIPRKVAGVGFARKAGMDEAMLRFLNSGKPDGIIACPDADVIVQNNFFKALDEGFKANPYMQAASLYYEHDLEKAADNGLRDKIVRYECHLRYMVEMQRLIGLPYAFQTVGSSMAVTAKGYMEQFGMNKRKAGEDFYFLHKFINAGRLFEINDTTVYPEARYSDRVPFGTGRTMLQAPGEGLKTYHNKTYESLQSLTGNLESLYECDDWSEIRLEDPVKSFFGEKLPSEIGKIKNHTKDFGSFHKRFYRWFDAFQMIKYQHFCRDHFFENIPVEQACGVLFQKMRVRPPKELELQLVQLRNMAKSGYKKREY